MGPVFKLKYNLLDGMITSEYAYQHFCQAQSSSSLAGPTLALFLIDLDQTQQLK